MLTPVQKMRDNILKVRYNSDEAQHLVRVLEEINFIMRQRIMTNLLK